MLLTDDPIPGLEAVNVCFKRVEVVFADEQGPRSVADGVGTIDILKLRNGVTQELGSAPLPAGLIQQVRLILCDEGHSVVVDGQTQPLTVPSGQESGLKLTRPGGFEIRPNVTTTVVVDFDAEASVKLHESSGQGYILRPVVRLEDALRLTVDSPQQGALVPSTPLSVVGTVAVPTDDVVSSVTVNGAPAEVSGTAWTANVVPSPAGADYTIEVVATAQSGVTAKVTISVHAAELSPTWSSLVAGPQTVLADGAAFSLLTVRAIDTTGQPVPRQPVEFAVSDPGSVLNPASTVTGDDGLATSRLTSASAGWKAIAALLPALPAAVRLTGPPVRFVSPSPGCDQPGGVCRPPIVNCCIGGACNIVETSACATPVRPAQTAEEWLASELILTSRRCPIVGDFDRKPGPDAKLGDVIAWFFDHPKVGLVVKGEITAAEPFKIDDSVIMTACDLKVTKVFKGLPMPPPPPCPAPGVDCSWGSYTCPAQAGCEPLLPDCDVALPCLPAPDVHLPILGYGGALGNETHTAFHLPQCAAGEEVIAFVRFDEVFPMFVSDRKLYAIVRTKDGQPSLYGQKVEQFIVDTLKGGEP